MRNAFHLQLKPRTDDLPPLDIQVALDGRSLKCQIRTINLFGIYRHGDIDDLMFQRHQDMEPWVSLDTMVVETIVFPENSSRRHLSIRTLETPPAIGREVLELF